MNDIKEIAEDLKIEFILPIIDEYINEYESFSKSLDDQQSTVDSIEELFGWLYDIEKLTVVSVKSSILCSNWIKTEDNVIELAAFIIQVIRSSFELHPYLLELLIQLDEEENKNTKILLPFVAKQLLLSIGENFAICSFIYTLYKKEIIKKEDILEKINDSFKQKHDFYISYNLTENLYFWFLPELIELNCAILLENLNNEEYKNSNKYSLGSRNENRFFTQFITSYYPDKIDLYKAMRDKGEPEDELTKSLRIDDVDTVQSIISKSNIDSANYILPFTIFDDFKDNGNMKLIDYAAAYGSIKCFKYLLLNHSSYGESTFHYAVCGRNTEIIKIVNQNSSPVQQTNQKNIRNRGSGFDKSESISSSLIHDILPAIVKHQNNLFDWILEQKYSERIEDCASSLLFYSILNGNAHSFIEVLDKNPQISDQKLINNAAKNGFYKLTQLAYEILNKKLQEENTDQSSLIIFEKLRIKERNPVFMPNCTSFGSLSIFKLGLKLSALSNISEALCICIKNDYQNIFNYYFDEIIKNDSSKLSFSFVQEVANEALKSKYNYYFTHLIEQIKLIKPDFFYRFNISQLMDTACQTKRIENVKTIMKIIKDYKQDCNVTSSFLAAASNNNTEICKCIIDDKYFTINYQAFLENFLIGSLNIEIYTMIMDNMNPEIKESFLFCSLYPSVQSNNKDLVEFLLNKKVPCEDALIHATRINSLDIINIILKHNSSPSFINKKVRDGTALLIATNGNNIKIVKRLLSVPGIDPSLYENKDQTPLICSIVNLNYDIMCEILNFYGDDIQSQTWQLDKAIKLTLSILSNSENNKANSERTKKIVNGRPVQVSPDEQKSKLLTIIKRILQIKNIDPNSHCGEHTLLSYACEANEIDIVKMLLKTDRIDVNAYAPNNGNTPLMISILNRNVEIAKLLINDKRTNINAKNYEEQTALTLAVNANLESIVSLLIKDEKFDSFESRLNYAFFYSKDPISNLLISDKSIDINYKIRFHYFNNRLSNIIDRNVYKTPLFNAITCNDVNKINMIIHFPSFDKVKSQLTSCIFESVRLNNTKIFYILLNLIDNDVNFCNHNKVSLLEAAVYCSSNHIVSEILNHEKFDREKVNIPELFQNSILDECFSYQIAETIYNFDENHDHLIDINQISQDKGFFMEISKNDNSSFCHQIISFLLEHGADPSKPNKDGIYPVEYAVITSNNTLLSELLISDKIDINQQIQINNEKHFELLGRFDYLIDEIKFTTYLNLAAKSEDEGILILLLEKEGININAEDSLGNTPLMNACIYKNEYMVNILFDFETQELDFLHQNKEGKDALSLFDIKIKQPQNKSEYKNALLEGFRKKKNNKFSFSFL